MFGNAITDAKGKTPTSGGTTVLADASGVLRLNGFKFYSTGTLFADLIAVSAVDVDGQDLQAIVPADRDGVELYDDWDGFGQRLTASGSTRFTDVVAERLALSAAQRLFDTGGASATARTLNLDRHWRNARTVASHNPLAYKAHASGNYVLNGVWPPANGYF